MLKTVSAAFAATALLVTAVPAMAQDAEPDTETGSDTDAQADRDLRDADDAEAVAQDVDRRTFPPVNFDASEDPDTIWVLDLSNGERVMIRLMEEWAPAHVDRIKTLTREGFYDGIIFHRVIDGFMAQGGDPTGTGQGGSALPDLGEEFNPMPHVRGSVSMARANDENSANSQFFIVFYPRFSLDKRYTNLGRVIDNMAAVDAINRGEPPQDPTRILQASLLSDNRPPPAPTPERQPQQDITADLLSAPLQ